MPTRACSSSFFSLNSVSSLEYSPRECKTLGRFFGEECSRNAASSSSQEINESLFRFGDAVFLLDVIFGATQHKGDNVVVVASEKYDQETADRFQSGNYPCSHRISIQIRLSLSISAQVVVIPAPPYEVPSLCC
mmetsp:Transcript_5389/g.20121  ORF Transcript_5389/g.20121 Transcript_5389/m.20121 type:complete len:134 (-) Transcript_5389:622-1023(-)